MIVTDYIYCYTGAFFFIDESGSKKAALGLSALPPPSWTKKYCTYTLIATIVDSNFTL